MCKTQTEQIRAATYAYIIAINPGHSCFAIYLQTGDSELSILWPGDEEKSTRVDESGNVKHKHAPLLPYQVYSRVGKLPAFHFHLTGGGYCKADELRRVLAEINPGLEIRKLVGGWHPSPSML